MAKGVTFERRVWNLHCTPVQRGLPPGVASHSLAASRRRQWGNSAPKEITALFLGKSRFVSRANTISRLAQMSRLARLSGLALASGVTVGFSWLWSTPACAEKITNDVAVFAALDKVTARISPMEIKLGQTVTFGALKVTPRVCNTRPPDEAPVTTAFVEIDEIQLDGKAKRIFTGWMFAQSPGLHGVEHPVFDVWLTNCKAPHNEKPMPVADERPPREERPQREDRPRDRPPREDRAPRDDRQPRQQQPSRPRQPSQPTQPSAPSPWGARPY